MRRIQIIRRPHLSGVNYSISPTCLRNAFTRADLKSVNIKSSCHNLFALLGSELVKAVHKMLMKSTPGHQALRRHSNNT